MRSLRALFAVAVGVVTLVAAGSAAAGSPISVIATTTQLQDLVRNVGGRHVKVVGVLRPNVDPHDYEPTPRDAGAISGAKLVVVSGVGLDTWMEKLIANVGSKALVVDASQGLKLRKGDAQEPQGDPHWWHDPTNFERAAVAVAAKLEQVDPANARAYAAAARRYERAIAAIDE